MTQDYDPSHFWDERYRKYGHTGWSSSLIYSYDQPLRLKAIEKTLSRVGISVDRQSRILDIGCGTGDLVQWFQDKGAWVTGIDISEEVVAKAKQRFVGNPSVQFFTERVENLDFPANSFDLVTSITVLQHIVEDSLFLTAVHKIVDIVKKGGHVVILEASPYNTVSTQAVPYVVHRARQQYIQAFSQAGCQFVREALYPQTGVTLVQRFSQLASAVSQRRDELGAEPGGGATSQSLPGRLYKVASRLILGLAYPLDYWLFLPPPSQCAEHRILIFKKAD